jgi:isoleucyl-tRNA synthetase
VPALPDLPALDHEVLGLWAGARVAARAAARADRAPGATDAAAAEQQGRAGTDAPNAEMPGVHHIRPMALRDLYARYFTMRGEHVPHSSGRAYSGLAVEVAVEKQLGLGSPGEIEAYGVRRFIERRDEFVARHCGVYGPFSRRMGFWRDEPASQAQDSYGVDPAWTTLRRAFDAGRLVRREVVGPYCPRCRTTLGPGDYEDGADRAASTELAVTVRLRLRPPLAPANPLLRHAELLVWTPAPWRLLGAAGVAVQPDEAYVIARRSGSDDRLVVSETAHARVLGPQWAIACQMPGTELAGLRYEPAFGPAFALAGAGELVGAHRVVPASFVRTGLGTGLAHLAGAFGPSDHAACIEHHLPVIDPLGPDGRFDSRLPLVGGRSWAAADAIVTADLGDRGLLFASERRQVRRRCCRGCGTTLIWRARPTWLLDGTAISRTRFLGLPLPVWECANGHLTCPGSIAELSALAGRELTGIDPRRPELDAVAFGCPVCAAQARRVADVAEAADLAEVAGRSCDDAPGRRGPRRAAPGRPSQRSLAGAGPVADFEGRTMAARSGTTMEPLQLIERHGADALRWFFTAAAAPSAVLRLAPERVDQITRRVLLRYLNMIAFWCQRTTIAAAGDRPPESVGLTSSARPPGLSTAADGARPAVDRWALSELQLLIAEVTDALDAFETVRAGRAIARFVDQLSRWYLRVSRRRFGGDAAGSCAFATLHECLQTLSQLMAPIAPFASDYAWQQLRPRAAADSVHLTAWPVPAMSLIDAPVCQEMALVKRICTLGRAARAGARIALRRPLASAQVTIDKAAAIRAAGSAIVSGELLALLAAELNVREVDVPSGSGALAAPVVGAARRPARAVAARGGIAVSLDVTITPELWREGLARAAIRAIQRGRRQDGFAPGEPIEVRWHSGDAEMALAMTEYRATIGTETRARLLVRRTVADGGVLADFAEHHEPALGLAFWLGHGPGDGT